MKLYLAHLGFYDDRYGMYEIHINKLAAAVIEEGKSADIDYHAPAPAFVPMVAVAAGYVVSEAVKLLTGFQPSALSNKLKAFCFDRMSIDTLEEWQKNEHCSVCGSVQELTR